MTQPDDTDRKAAEDYLAKRYGSPKSGSLRKQFLPMVYALAQFRADARAAGAAEMKERCAEFLATRAELRLPDDSDEYESLLNAAAAIRALK